MTYEEMMGTGEVSVGKMLKELHFNLDPFFELLTEYECAALEVETKFKVLNLSFSMNGEKNPIESIKTRVKSPESIIGKLDRLGLPMELESITNHLFDVAGVRVVCSFIDEIYRLEEKLLAQEDVELVQRKDYIKNPKPSGYRSLHLIIRTPIYTEDGRKNMVVEVQMRTIAMDFWASLEHKLRYKKNLDANTLKRLGEELERCAAESARLDTRMQDIKNEIEKERAVPGDDVTLSGTGDLA